MSLEDPFFVVKDEIVKAIANNKTLFERWNQYQDPSSLPSKEDIDWTTSELRKGLRSIEWDLEDLEETVAIVEKNPKKFKIDDKEIKSRKAFIEQSKNEVKCMKEAILESKAKNKKMRPSSMELMVTQDEELEGIQTSVGTLKSMSKQIGNELDEQSVMLDDLGHDMDNTESKIDGALKKMAKVLHMSNDRRQWMAIGALSGVMVVVVALFFLL
ncbi:syntaxin-6-like isoform X2 [Dermacentor silvarum]|uniref:syntaxin-6-like isoform X2 n=1 Tax=Dermacentor silvarum TaxID=543639 RepID=UPI002100B5EA|nr:syntaxin-6-like isoform X2 [Dermacentor silvarum]